jgi:NADH-quinone oxidoreductase subunit I/NAD(P)H-quinone oxidoreductase subunit I
MGSFGEYLAGIGRSIVTLGDGLAVTFSYLLRKPFTIQYPDRTEKPVVAMLPERSRGILEVDVEVCTGCTMCAKQCPIDCIHIEVVKDEETKQRMIKRFDIDVAKCMYCGLCVEACPASGLRHSHEFEGAVGDVRRLMLHFVEKPLPVSKPAKKGEPQPETKPLGSIVRKLLADQWKPADAGGGSP